MELREEQLAGPRALTFGMLGGLVSWAFVLAVVFGFKAAG